MKFGFLLKESFSLLLRQPKLFLPKILVAFLYGIAMLATASVSIESFPMILAQSADVEKIYSILFALFALLVYSTAVLAVDVLTNAMYPVMVKDFNEGKKISFKAAFHSALKKFIVVFPAVILIEFAVAIPFALISSLLILTSNFSVLLFLIFLFLAVSFALTLLFYVIYPAGVLKESSPISALSSSFSMGKSNIKQLSIPAVIPFFLSLANFALAFLASNAAFLAAFIFSRFLLALLYAYHMILNPKIYFALTEGGEQH